MCGIAGFFATRAIEAATLQRMLDALAQRGPDARHVTGWDAGWRRRDDAPVNGFVHARLSIIDPRPIADQPMSNAAGDVWICYNGEVYGWEEDARALERQGAVFSTRSDTEFILHAWQAWGWDMLPRLRGMFAIALLDLRAGQLHLVRDRLGKKPLVYAHAGGEFAFGSTVRAVLPFLPRDRRDIDPAAVDAYLAHRYIPAPMTILRDVRRLPAAHRLTLDLSTREIRTACYWQPSPTAGGAWLPELDRAVHLRTVADRPLGLFLSSGIDSSLVASRLAATGHGGLQTFTAGFADAGMDESALAADIAARLGFPNRVVPIPERIDADLDRIVADLDEPFADPSCVPTWYLARETTHHVKVVLGGDGGDELFAGYKRFDKHLRSRWRQRIAFGGAPRPSAAGLLGKGMAKVLDEARLPWAEAYSLRFSGFTPSQRAALQPALGAAPAVYWRMPDLTGIASPLKQLLEIDRLNYLPEYILRKGDLTTMAHGLELRTPLLDHRLVEIVLGLPDEARFTTPRKTLLAEGMPALAPLSLFDRKKKGFNPPLGAWLQRDLAHRLDGLGARLADVTLGQVDAGAVDRITAAYRGGDTYLAEQLLQLVLLSISLAQIRALAAAA